MKWCESDAIATVMQALTFFFFLEDSSTIRRTRFVSIVVGNESDDNSYVAYDRGSQNRRFVKQQIRKEGAREAAGSQRRGLRSKKFGNLCRRQ